MVTSSKLKAQVVVFEVPQISYEPLIIAGITEDDKYVVKVWCDTRGESGCIYGYLEIPPSVVAQHPVIKYVDLIPLFSAAYLCEVDDSGFESPDLTPIAREAWISEYGPDCSSDLVIDFSQLNKDI